MANAEYLEQKGCLQRDSAEHEEYAGAQSAGVRESRTVRTVVWEVAHSTNG
jgi:hypothetical protein